MSIPVVPLRPLPPGRTAYADIPIKWRRLFDDKIGEFEGGYQNDPDDHGNFTRAGLNLGTMRGTTPRTNAAFLRIPDSQLTQADMLAITHARACEIAYAIFVDEPDLELISEFPFACFYWDFLWGTGPEAIRQLQEQVGAPVDGRIGPVTLGAIDAYMERVQYRRGGVLFTGVEAALQHACDRRNAYHQRVVASYPRKRKYLAGWTRRVESFRPQVPGELAELGTASIAPPVPGRKPVQPIPKPILGEPAPSLWERIIAVIAAIFGGPTQAPAT